MIREGGGSRDSGENGSSNKGGEGAEGRSSTVEKMSQEILHESTLGFRINLVF